MSYKLSVIIPCFNRENELKKSIQSVINQSLGFENIELIIVDDSSTDNTQKIIKEYAKKYVNIKYKFLEVNSGSPGKPRNIGIKIASTNYLMFLDCGDTYNYELCEKFYKIISSEKVDLVYSEFKTYCDGNVKYSNNLTDMNHIFSPDDFPNIFKDTYIWNKIFKKDIVINNNIYCLEKEFPEDSYFVIKYLLNINRIKSIGKYMGCNYIVPDINNDKDSLSRTSTYEKIEIYISGLKKLMDLFDYDKDTKIPEMVFSMHFTVLLSYFAKFNGSRNEKIEIVNLIYNLEREVKCDTIIYAKWGAVLNKFIEKRDYDKAIFFANVIFHLQNSNLIKKLYRRINR